MADDEEKVRVFLQWLTDNGASFPKISWPRSDTPSGIRGAVALEDIATDEHMLEIPAHLMMSPPQLLQHPLLGAAVKKSLDVLHGDVLLAVYITHELRLGESSFYKPYLDILPEPDCITEWRSRDLSALQDSRLVLRAKSRKMQIKRMYQRVFGELNQRFPDLFPLEEFSFDRFLFSWNTIQARAFGRRLPWTALVPFADCLNHTNVQTKYDYNVDSNGKFRLFPTGDNRFAKGAEVFNSYGRRPNDNLLMDYGFAMMDNEWDEVEIPLSVDYADEHMSTRCHMLRAMGFQATTVVSLSSKRLPLEALSFLRLCCLSKDGIDELFCAQERQAQMLDENENWDEHVSRQRDFFDHIFSVSNEINAIDKLIAELQSFLKSFSSIEEDLELLRSLSCFTDVDALEAAFGLQTEQGEEEFSQSVPTMEGLKDRLSSAVTYRVTRKRIVVSNIQALEELKSRLATSSSENAIKWMQDAFPLSDLYRDRTIERYIKKYEQYQSDLMKIM